MKEAMYVAACMQQDTWLFFANPMYLFYVLYPFISLDATGIINFKMCMPIGPLYNFQHTVNSLIMLMCVRDLSGYFCDYL